MAKYLKDYVKEVGTLPLRIESVGSPETNRNGKVVRLTVLKIKSTGAEITESLLDTTFKYDLKGAKVGDNIEAFTKDNGYTGYRIIASGGDENMGSPSQNNSQQVASERKVTESMAKEAEAAHKKEMGYAKSQIGNNLGMSTKLFMDSLKDLKPFEFDRTKAYSKEELHELHKAYLTEIFTGALELAQHVRPRFNLAVNECYAEDTGEKIVANPETKPLFSKEELSALPF